MKQIEKIVVPVDFLQHTNKVTEYALYVAQKLDAAIFFAHVVEEAHVYGDFADPSLDNYVSRVAEHAEARMNKLVDQFRNSCSGCEGKVYQGDITDSIIMCAVEQDADLIIIGTHGRKGLEKMWLGSVAERVVKKAPCPTLTFNPSK